MSLNCIIYDMVSWVFLCYTMPCGLYLHLSPKDSILSENETNPEGFLGGWEKEMCYNKIYKIPYIVSVPASTQGGFFSISSLLNII